MSTKVKHSFVLLLTAFIWGNAFVAQSKGGELAGPFTFNAIRSLLGGLVLLPVIHQLNKQETNENTVDKKGLWRAGSICGILLFLGTILQQFGLYFGASAGKAGFLTACYILIVPILGMFRGKRCGIHIWIAVAIALVGLYLLCVKGGFYLERPDLLLLGCALVFSFHILVVDYFLPDVPAVPMSCIQLFVSGMLNTICMFLFEVKPCSDGWAEWTQTLQTSQVWIAILYAGILSSGAGYTLQIIGQKGVHPTIASLIMSLESVFAVLAGWVILNQRMNGREIFGCVLLFVAIIIALLFEKNSNKKI